MVTYSRAAHATFRAIAEPTRRRLLDALARGARPAGALAAKFPSSRPAIARHLRVLREARLVRVRREGRRQIYELTPAPLQAVRRWVDRYEVFWSVRLDELGEYVERMEKSRRGGGGR
ncbi:MAG: ArsR/SmtB family transcription factor [Thermoanaerobaculia bacterium]